MGITVSAVKHYGIIGYGKTPVSEKKLGHGSFQMIQGPALVLAPGNAIHQGPRRLSEYPDIGQLVFDGLECGNGPAELDPSPGIAGTSFFKIGGGPHKRGQQCAAIPFNSLHGI